MKYPIKKIGIKHLDWVSLILETDLPAYSKMIAMYLSRFMNKDQDMAWPSLRRIEAELSITRATACKYLDLLENEGWLLRDRGNHSKTTRYIVGIPEQIEGVVHQLNHVVHDMNQGGSPDKPGVVHHTDTNHKLESINKNKTLMSSRPVNDCPYQKIVDLYHEVLPNHPKVRVLTQARKSAIKQRHMHDMDCSLEEWESYFGLVKRSKFLTGQTQPMNGGRVFIADLEWITKQGNFAKIYEGKYHG